MKKRNLLLIIVIAVLLLAAGIGIFIGTQAKKDGVSNVLEFNPAQITKIEFAAGHNDSKTEISDPNDREAFLSLFDGVSAKETDAPSPNVRTGAGITFYLYDKKERQTAVFRLLSKDCASENSEKVRWFQLEPAIETEKLNAILETYRFPDPISNEEGEDS